MRTSESLTLACSWDSFSPAGLLCPTLIGFIIFCHLWLLSLRSLFFSNETEREWIQRGGAVGRNLEEWERGKTMIITIIR